MFIKLDKSAAPTVFAFVGEALFVAIVASMPVCAAVGFAAITGSRSG
jgi:hypothetical protein